MEIIVRILIGSISQLVLYKAIYSYIVNHHGSKQVSYHGSVTDRFTGAELLSYKEMLFEEATEVCYAQRDPEEVDREECNCIRLGEQFGHLMEEHRERFFTYVLLQSQTQSVAAHLESYLLHMHYTSQLDNLYDNIEVDLLEVDWIAWDRDYAYNKMWGDSRTSILKAMKCKL